MNCKGFGTLSAVLALGLLSLSFAQAPDTLWTRTFTDRGGKLLDTGNGEYVFTGRAIYASEGSETMDSSKFALLWVNDAGDSLGSVTIDGPERFQQCNESARLVNGDILVQGWGYSSVADTVEYNVVTCRVDAAGGLIWARLDVVYANDVLATSDGGALLIRSHYEEGATDAAATKIDINGDVLWSHFYGIGERSESANCIIRTSDGGYLLVGDWHEVPGIYVGGYIAKLDGDFNEMWSRYFERVSDADNWNLAAEAADGSFLVFGHDGLIGSSHWTYRVSADGDSLTGRIFTDNTSRNTPHDIIPAQGGGFTIAGATDGFSQPWIARIDEFGDLLWERCCWGNQSEALYNQLGTIFQLSDGGYLLGGGRNGLGAWLIRTEPDPFDASDARPEMAGNTTLHQNYPNPFNPSTTIGFELPRPADVRLTVYDITGRQVAELVREVMSAGQHRVVWNAEHAASGVYFYRLQAGEFMDARKMAVIK